MNASAPSTFTPLHRHLGLLPQPLTVELLDAAAAASLEETADLDFKLDPPAASALATADLAKDIAAMANSGGGMLLFGIRDKESHASDAPGIDAAYITETYIRDVRRVALNRISPPILNLTVQPITNGTRHSLAIIVPAVEQVPYLIFANDSFRAPYRNGPDTAFMSERMLEQAYRTRFNAQRERDTGLADLIEQALGLRGPHEPLDELWIAAVGRPTNPGAHIQRLERSRVAALFTSALDLARTWVQLQVHPLEWLDYSNPRPGLRRWVARFGREGAATRWRDAQAQILDNGTVTLVAAMGGGRGGATTEFGPSEVGSDRVETFIANFMALVGETAKELGLPAYEVRIEFGPHPDGPIVLRIPDRHLSGHYLDEEYSAPIHHFAPIEATIDAAASAESVLDQLRELALDVVNQGGVQYLHSIEAPDVTD